MPQVMPGMGGASCRQIHCVCASWPAAGRTATFCAGRGVSARAKGLVGTRERGQCPCQGAGGRWGGGHDFTNMGGQLGVENLATKRSRSMVRTDQLPWGASEEQGGQTCRCDPLPTPGTSTALLACHSPAVSEVVVPVAVSTTNTS